MSSKCRVHCALVAVLLSLFVGYSDATAKEPALNQLTKSEKKKGWKLLFDGRTLEGWRRFGKQEAPGKGWTVEDGILKLKAGAEGGDIITLETFTDYELRWEWRIEKGANNGVKYLVSEERPNSPGPEYQMVDNATMPDLKHRTAGLYHIIAPLDDFTKPVGEWNQSRIIVQGKHVEHWLNGKKSVEYELESPELKAAIANSKFKNVADFDKKLTGHILLTDHHDEAWYRNIKILEKKK